MTANLVRVRLVLSIAQGFSFQSFAAGGGGGVPVSQGNEVTVGGSIEGALSVYFFA